MSGFQIDLEAIGSIFEASANEIYFFDTKTFFFIYANRGAKKNLGYSDEEIRNLKPWDLKPLFSEETFKKYLAQSIESESNFSIETIHQRKDGTTYPVEASVHQSKYQNRDVYVAVVLDVTEIQKTRLQLANKEAFLMKVLDSVPGAIFCKDYQESPGKFVFWNHSAEKLWGLSKDDVLNKSDFDLFPEDQAKFFEKKDKETLETGELIFIEEEPVDSPTVGRRMVKTWKVPIEENLKNRYLLGISIDISEQKEFQKKYEEEKTKLLHASKLASLGEMAASIAHEINNPLTVIHGFTNFIRKMSTRKNLTEKELLNKLDSIDWHIVRMSKIVNGLRTFSRDGSEDPFEAESMENILESSLELCHAQIEIMGIKFSVQLEKKLPRFKCRKIQITQVVVNLLNNARVAVKDSKDKWIKVNVFRDQDLIVTQISDSGPPIPVEIQEKLFNPFFTTKKQGEGTGIGLSICKGIINSHQGEIYFDPSKKNTTFVFKLPTKQ